MKQKKHFLKKNNDLIYHFDLLEGIQIQQMLIALYRGYEVVDVVTTDCGVVEFRLSREIQND